MISGPSPKLARATRTNGYDWFDPDDDDHSLSGMQVLPLPDDEEWEYAEEDDARYDIKAAA